MSVTRERIQGETAAAAMCITRDEISYPANLREIPLPPERLWVRGRVEADDTLAIAIVGAREATQYGIGCAERLAADLAARGITIISGLARGIDSAAHRGALRAGGRTIAVLGSGVDVIYPPENRRLALEVADRGAVVSQFPLRTPPLAGYFPARNRVIAGLSLGVVVVEAAEKSGSLITAGLAGELGREVMAVPGPLTSLMSRGAHRLIQDGAALVQGWEDVVAQLPLRFRDQVKPVVGTAPAGSPNHLAHGQHAEGHVEDKEADSEDESSRLLQIIGREPIGIDQIIERSGMVPGRTSALLMTLEIEGRIRQLEGKRFVVSS